MTHDEKVAMYMKLTKRDLAEMLATANAALEAMGPQVAHHYEQAWPALNPPWVITCTEFRPGGGGGGR